MKPISFLAPLFASLLATGSAWAVPVLSDHFDDGSLDPAWQVTFLNASGWAFSESGTSLTATDITSTVNDTGGGGAWATVYLTRNFSALADFDVAIDFSWDSENSDRAMQIVGLELLDAQGNSIVQTYYSDAWIAGSGSQVARIGTNSVNSGFDSMPLTGAASVGITRSGSNIDILWDGATLLSGVDSRPISAIELEYEFYSFTGAGGPSFFGNESIDRVSVAGDPANSVALPPVSWLFGAGLLGLLRYRRAS